MYRRKQYGQSKIDSCPFCGKQATAHNSQGVPVCSAHRNKGISNLKCICGEWLDIKSGKWGPYFHCMNCGNMNFRKVLEMNPDLGKDGLNKEKNPDNQNKKSADEKENEKMINKNKQVGTKQDKSEIVVTSDELDFLY